ncbi:MAG: PstS family phosphate ABC transporter substrate-binding protein [Candidatus Omnitrophica bacterium]|nr:PstS family phosphate ABC transporter substrate-binding protein [Candidatus Omnitrophota bacterium]
MKRFGLVAAVVALAAGAHLARAGTGEGVLAVDPGLPPYQTVGGISGNLSSVGSDTLNNLMTLWAEGFRKKYPNVRIQIEGKGSTTAPPALISRVAQLGPMSRPMKSSEIDAFEKKFGYKPTAVGVALDALAVYVNKDNPIERLTLQEVDAIFSSTRLSGAPRDITTWGEQGLAGEWESLPISLYGRNSASGTYGYFKEHALSKGDFKNSVKEQPGSAAVVEGITNDRAGIGYSGLGYRTAGVRAVPLQAPGSVSVYEATPDHVYAGSYPLSRYLYVYVNKAPGRPLDPLVEQFLEYVLSIEGQEVVVKDGYVPLAKEIAEAERAKLH